MKIAKTKKYLVENLVRNLNICSVDRSNYCLEECSSRCLVCAGECASSHSDGSCGGVVEWLADCELLRLQSDFDAIGAPLKEGAHYLPLDAY